MKGGPAQGGGGRGLEGRKKEGFGKIAQKGRRKKRRREIVNFFKIWGKHRKRLNPLENRHNKKSERPSTK